jgi:hypothetical protein
VQLELPLANAFDSNAGDDLVAGAPAHEEAGSHGRTIDVVRPSGYPGDERNDARVIGTLPEIDDSHPVLLPSDRGRDRASTGS